MHRIDQFQRLNLAIPAGAVTEFRDRARQLIDYWRDAQNLCAAHSGTLLARDNTGTSISKRLEEALRKCEPRLRIHRLRYG